MNLPALSERFRLLLPLAVATLSVGLYAAGQLGPWVVPLDLLAQFSLQLLSMICVGLVAMFWLRRALAVLVFGTVAAILLPVVLSKWYERGGALALPSPPPTMLPSRPKRLKLLTFNVFHLNGNESAVASEILSHNADIVILTEFGPDKRLLRARMARAYASVNSCGKHWRCSMAIYSRYRLIAKMQKFPGIGKGSGWLRSTIRVGGRTINVIGTHIVSPRRDPAANIAELDALARLVRRTGGPMIVAGDFNTTLWANAFRRFRINSGLVHMGHLLPTWPMRPIAFPQLGIDHVFTTPDLKVTHLQSGRAAGSDHAPVIATVEFSVN